MYISKIIVSIYACVVVALNAGKMISDEKPNCDKINIIIWAFIACTWVWL